MRLFTAVTCATLAFAGLAFAGENTGEIVKTKIANPGAGNPFEVIVNDAGGNPLVKVTCPKMDEGKGDVKVWYLDPEHMPKPDEKFDFTYASKMEEVDGNNVVGLVQLQNFYPEGGAVVTVEISVCGSVLNRIKYGTLKETSFVAAGGIPGEWGSVVNTSGIKGDKEEGVDRPKYMDLAEYGVSVAYDAAGEKATFSYTHNPLKGSIIKDGQAELGILAVTK